MFRKEVGHGAVEVLSPGSARYDRVDKMKLYHEFGVKQCWIVDAEQETLEVFDLTGDAPRLVAAQAGEETFRPQLFPRLDIRLGEVWSRTDSKR